MASQTKTSRMNSYCFAAANRVSLATENERSNCAVGYGNTCEAGVFCECACRLWRRDEGTEDMIEMCMGIAPLNTPGFSVILFARKAFHSHTNLSAIRQ